MWREKNVIKPAPGKRQCNCRNEVYHRQIGPGMFQQMTEQVCFSQENSTNGFFFKGRCPSNLVVLDFAFSYCIPML